MTWVVPQAFNQEKLDLTSHYAYSFKDLYHIDFVRDRENISSVKHFNISEAGRFTGYILGDDYLWKTITYVTQGNNHTHITLPYYALQLNQERGSEDIFLCQSITPAGCVYVMLLLIHTDDPKCILNLNATDIVKSIREMDALWVDQFTSYADVPEVYRINKLQEKDFDALKAEAKKHDGKVEGIKELCAKQLLLDITGRE